MNNHPLSFSFVPRHAFEILNTGTFRLILLNLTIKYKSLVINEIKKNYILLLKQKEQLLRKEEEI